MTEDKLVELWLRLKKSPHTRRVYQHDLDLFRDFVAKPLIAVMQESASILWTAWTNWRFSISVAS